MLETKGMYMPMVSKSKLQEIVVLNMLANSEVEPYQDLLHKLCTRKDPQKLEVIGILDSQLRCLPKQWLENSQF
jgi:hypothetical protein